jgi:hypothetical protein
MRSAYDFLTLLFGAATAELFVLLWTLPDKRSRFFPGTRLIEAAQYGADQARACDVYVGCGVRGRDFGPHERGTAADVVGIPGLWADLDLTKPPRRKPYFRTREALTMFLDALPLRPTLRVWTGGGVQPWWLFRELWMFEDECERQRAAGIMHCWQRYLRARALEHGATIDATHDLARILRVPGTVNHKYGTDGTVVVLEAVGGLRCNPLELAELAGDVSVEGDSIVAAVAAPISPSAEFPAAKLDALLRWDPRFRQTWNHERKDFRDQSLSIYDQSLASRAARDGWSDGELVALLMAHRQRFGGTEKLARPDYLARTIARARSQTDATGARVEVRPGGLRVRRL